MSKGPLTALTGKQRAALHGFALDVLAILESNEEWGADTLEEISQSSVRHGLSTQDRDGFFRIARIYKGGRG